MNYTNPNDPDHVDDPKDWLNSSLIFSNALSLILREGEGIVVDIKEDMNFPGDESIEKVIVFHSEKMVRVIECEDDLKEGTWVIVHDINLN